MNIFSQPTEMPMGLGMALMKNPNAMNSFSAMTNEQKRAVIERTHSINSKEEMEAYVRTLSIES
ncbi:MAG: hypothetical protein GXY01_01105 [Clostridiales bacterium]|jgi:uncharacterized protein YdeI (YjbR/CyaY-like superfamily)|nr:hypothetical protein [Clostridiales bacterium]